MSIVFIHRLRLAITFFAFFTGVSEIVYSASYIARYGVAEYNIYYLSNPTQWRWPAQLALSGFIFVTYLYTVLTSRRKNRVHKGIRAFWCLLLSVFALYVSLFAIDQYNGHFYCLPPITARCGSRLASVVLIAICGFSMLIEIPLTVKLDHGPLPPKDIVTVVPPQTVMPLPYMYPRVQQQPFYPYQQQQSGFYPQGQQPPPTGGYPPYQPGTFSTYGEQQKFENQADPYGQHQLQHLQPQQPNPYQQQQQQSSAQTPGSMVTTMPQPGGQPIAPYPSPGVSIAVSPVLPVGGYGTPPEVHSPVAYAQ